MPTDPMKFIEVERAGETLVLVPQSNLHAFQQLDAEANEILKLLDLAPGTNVIIDCHNMDFVGSMTLGFFMQLWLRVRVRKGRMVFCDLSDQVQEVLRLTKADTLWRICSSRSEALEILSEPAPSRF